VSKVTSLPKPAVLSAAVNCFLMRQPHIRVGLLAISIVVSMSCVLQAQCRPGDPSGRFDGLATSSQAGKLDLSLNLRCNKNAYAGTLNTPIGIFTVSSGSFTGTALTLELTANGSTILLKVASKGTALQGTFSTADDKGPVDLHRVGDAVPVDHAPAVTPAQWREDLRYLVKQLTTLHPEPVREHAKTQVRCSGRGARRESEPFKS
jgi:hypothetical protein